MKTAIVIAALLLAGCCGSDEPSRPEHVEKATELCRSNGGVQSFKPRSLMDRTDRRRGVEVFCKNGAFFNHVWEYLKVQA